MSHLATDCMQRLMDLPGRAVTDDAPTVAALFDGEDSIDRRKLVARCCESNAQQMMPLLDFIQTALKDEFARVDHENVVRHQLDFVQQVGRKYRSSPVVCNGANECIQDVTSHDSIKAR